MRIVIDTNVFMSALYFGGNPLKVVNLMQENRFDVFATPDIINEYNEVYYRLEKKAGKKANKFVLDNILHYLNVIPDSNSIMASRDKEDDKFLNCAVNCKALYIVSGDKDLLVLKECRGVKIVTVNEFLQLFLAWFFSEGYAKLAYSN